MSTNLVRRRENERVANEPPAHASRAIRLVLLIAIGSISCGQEETRQVSVAECSMPQSDNPYDIPAAMTNASETRRTFAEAYNRAIIDKTQDIPRRVGLAISVNESGGVYKSEVETSSGSPIHDSVAVQVSRTFKFNPAHKGNTPVCVRISVPVNFPPQS